MSEQTGGELEWVGLEELKSEDWARPRSGKNMGAWMELSGGLFFFSQCNGCLMEEKVTVWVGGGASCSHATNQPSASKER